jgi:hypothetical protein
MAYQKDIPQATDQLSQSQADILGNFQALGPLVNGINNYIILPEQATSPATLVNQMALYTKDVGGFTALFLKPENSASPAGPERDITTIVGNANGNCITLPSGIKVQWGNAGFSGIPIPGIKQITFPVAFAGAPIGIYLTPIYPDQGGGNYEQNYFFAVASGASAQILPTSFYIYLTLRDLQTAGGANVPSCNWLAIGV